MLYLLIDSPCLVIADDYELIKKEESQIENKKQPFGVINTSEENGVLGHWKLNCA